MNKIILTGFLAAAFMVFGIISAHAQVLDFNDLEKNGDGFTLMPSYSGQNFFLTSSVTQDDAFVSFNNESSLYFGSANLINNYPVSSTTLTKESNALFTLDSINLHGINSATTAVFLAYNATGGQMAAHQFEISDTSDWHTVTFDSCFRNVSSVVWQQTQQFAFDNVKLNSVVPEPISCVLFGIGGLTLAAARRFRKR